MSHIPEPNRRQFLAVSAAAFAVPALDATWSRPDPIGLGVIGVGIRGRNLMRGSFLPNEGFRVRVICEVDNVGCRKTDSEWNKREIETENVGIFFGTYESAHSVYFWDPRASKFIQEWLSD